MSDQIWKRKGGRPSPRESERRTREFVRLVVGGSPFAAAQKQSGLAPATALRLFDEPTFQAVARAVIDGRLGPVAVIVAPAAEAA